MDDFLTRIVNLVKQGRARVSSHGYDELEKDRISVRDIIESIDRVVLIEDYPNYPKGPCALVLHEDKQGNPVHVVWGIPKGSSTPAVLVTAYRPDPGLWTSDFMRRK